MKIKEAEDIERTKMVRWFNPRLLIKLGLEVVVSALFGKYADQRRMQAALDDVPPDVHVKRADLTVSYCDDEEPVLVPDEEGAVWIDYVADLGEGFNPTYTMAYMLGQDTLKVGSETLPRGGVLIMGGDEVYPTASEEEYKRRMRVPYEAAYPDQHDRYDKTAKRPRLYAIPGNHDWYDGLTWFTRIFLRFRDRDPKFDSFWLGNWRCRQSRSYFALKLTDDCWLWGLDIQLKGYVDQPQVNYFRQMAKELSQDARVILCTAQPSWLKAATPEEREFKSLNYIAQLVDRLPGNQKAFLMLAGDIHHYSRYYEEGSGMQFITAGGGGAFLHPTHQLKHTIKGKWVKKDVTLTLANNPKDPNGDSCYPDKKTSQSLLWGNLKFVRKNWDFCLALGVIFGVLANWLVLAKLTVPDPNISLFSWQFLQSLPDTVWTGIKRLHVFFIAAGVLAIMTLYADVPKHLNKASLRFRKLLTGVLHGGLHLTILFVFTIIFHKFNQDYLATPISSANQIGYAILLFLQMGITTFFLSGTLWGLYLLVTCWLFGMHTNDGFSAMQIEGFKNFLRIKIQKDRITIYPIGLTKVPGDDEWVKNPDRDGDGTKPVFIPKEPLQPHLIEDPIMIDPATVKRIAQAEEVDGGVKKA